MSCTALLKASVTRSGCMHAQDRMDFLREDLAHLFDEQGIDKTAYEEKVNFQVGGQHLLLFEAGETVHKPAADA